MTNLILAASLYTGLTFAHQIDCWGAQDYSQRILGSYPTVRQQLGMDEGVYKTRNGCYLKYNEPQPLMEDYCRSLGNSRCVVDR